LNHPDPATNCPSFQRAATDAVIGGPNDPALNLVAAATSDPLPSRGARQFHTGLELGTDDIAELTRARYCHLIGVLGAWDAGKTCFLLSLYLMASGNSLPGDYLCAGSLTLKGFEERARRIRNWDSATPLPEQLADHTSLADPRQPALLHLALRERGGDRQRYDLLLTDLPGEWSKSLVDRAATAGRFDFLKRADGIIVVVDGPALASERRHVEVQRTKHLMDRLIHSVRVDASVPLTLLLTKCDRISMKQPEAVAELVEHCKQLGFEPRAVLSAAFSNKPQTVPNGAGVFEAIQGVIKAEPPTRSAVASTEPAGKPHRSFAMFGGHR
jgi:GTPase SAR1 family protein